jgi:hypothetical protein
LVLEFGSTTGSGSMGVSGNNSSGNGMEKGISSDVGSGID